MSLMLGVIITEYDPSIPGGPFDIKARTHPAIEVIALDNLETIFKWGGLEGHPTDERWRTVMPLMLDGKLVHIVVRQTE